MTNKYSIIIVCILLCSPLPFWRGRIKIVNIGA